MDLWFVVWTSLGFQQLGVWAKSRKLSMNGRGLSDTHLIWHAVGVSGLELL